MQILRVHVAQLWHEATEAFRAPSRRVIGGVTEDGELLRSSKSSGSN